MLQVRNSKDLAGFTLLELLVVLMIMGMLAVFVAPKYFSQIGRSQTQVARAQIDSFEKALDQYRVDTGHFPSNEQGLQALFTQPTSEANWKGPYLRRGIPVDPWGNAYVYKIPSASVNMDYDILAYGKDGRAGGVGDDADVSNAR